MNDARLLRLRRAGTIAIGSIVVIAVFEAVVPLALVFASPMSAPHLIVDVALAGVVALLLVALGACVLVLRPSEAYVGSILQELEERRQRFESLFDNTADAMAIYGVDGLLGRVNSAAIAMVGSDPESIGKDYKHHVAPEFHAALTGSFERALAGASSEIDQVVIATDGREIPVIATYAPIVVREEVVGVVASAKDVTVQRRSEEHLLYSRERFRALFELHPDAIALLSASGRIMQINLAMEMLVGCKQERLVGKQFDVMVAPNELVIVKEHFENVLGGEAASFSSAILGSDGASIEVEADAIPTLVRGQVEGIFLVVKDVRKQRALERIELTQRERLRAVALLAAAHANDVAHQIDETLVFAARSLDLESAAVAVLQGDELEVIHSAGPIYAVGTLVPFASSYNRHSYGSVDLLIIADTDADEWKSDIARSVQPWRQVIATTIFVGGVAAGSITLTSTQPRRGDFDEGDRGFVRVVAALLGASLERERRERQLRNMAFIDTLTQLPNRAYFTEQLSGAIARVRRHKGSIAAHYIDLDGFKDVNDTFGHEAGDRVLVIMAQHLKAVIRESDVLARLGGDEFIVLQGECDGDSGALLLGNRLIAAAAEPIALSDGTLAQLSASVGVALAPKDALDASDLVRRADQAMYRAKDSGKNQVVLYQPDFGSSA